MNKKKIGVIAVIVLLVIVSVVLLIMLLVGNKKEYYVTFVSYGDIRETVKTNKGKVERPSVPVRENYKFIDWYYGNEKFDFDKKVTSNITVSAKWESITGETIKHNVIFYMNDGTDVKQEIEVNDSEKVSKILDPTRENYKFNGWLFNGNKFDFNTLITFDVQLYASWLSEDSKNYTVTFDLNGGVANIGLQEVAKEGKVMRPVDPKKDGYTFIGWYLDGKLYDFEKSVKKDIVLVAKWSKANEEKPENTEVPKKNQVSVTFKSNGGSNVDNQVIDKGGNALQPTNPIRNGYEFVGWYDSSKNKFNFNTKINENLVLSAIWAPVVEYKKQTDGKWIYINNPEVINSNDDLADSNLGGKSIYKDFITGTGEIYYSHQVAGELSNNIYYGIRFYNENNTPITITINKCGISNGWDTISIWKQYYSNSKCGLQDSYVIPPKTSRVIFHNLNKFTYGNSSVEGVSKLGSGPFNGVLNITSSGKVHVAAIAFKDITKTGNATYSGNRNDNRQAGNLTHANTRVYSGYYNGSNKVTNSLTFEIYDETPTGLQQISFKNVFGTTVIADGWKTNAIGGSIDTNNGYKAVLQDGIIGSDTINLIVPTSLNNTFTIGNFPHSRELRTNLHPSGVSIKGWPYNWANWAVHYVEKITVVNKTNNMRTISFRLGERQGVFAYTQGKMHDMSNQDYIWTTPIEANSSKTIDAYLVLGNNTNGTVIKQVYLHK